MSTSLSTPTPRPTTEVARSVRRCGAAAAVRWLCRSGALVAVWFWGIYALYAVGIAVGNAAAGNDLEVSALDATLGAQRWAVVWLGIAGVSVLLALHVSAGADRRSLIAGMVRAALLLGGAYGVVTTLALLGERLLSTSLGMSWRRLGGLPFESPLDVLGTAVAEGLVVTTYILAGAGVGAAFVRGRTWGLTLLVPLALPAALVDLASRTGVLGAIANVELRPDIEHAEVPSAEGLTALLTGVGGAALAALLAGVALHLLLRSAPVRPR